MSVVSFDFERVVGGTSLTATADKDKTQFVARFVAIVNDVWDGPVTIYHDARCPKFGSIYFLSGTEISPTAVATSFKWEQHGGRFDSETGGTSGKWKWTVEVTYSTPDANDQSPPGSSFAKVSYDTEQYDEILEYDLDGLMVLNSVHQKFDPPVVRERCRLIARIDKSVAGFDPSIAQLMSDAVNSSPFLGFPTNTLRITKISAHPVEDKTYGTYYALTVEMQFRPIEFPGHKPHQARILDAGRYQLGPDPTNFDIIQKITDQDGDLMADPVPLNGQGHRLKTNSDPQYKEFRRYRSIDFNLLGIYP